MRAIVLRHAEVPDVLRITDIHISKEGEGQSKQLGAKIKGIATDGPVEVLTSDKIRAIQTGLIIAQVLGIKSLEVRPTLYRGYAADETLFARLLAQEISTLVIVSHEHAIPRLAQMAIRKLFQVRSPLQPHPAAATGYIIENGTAKPFGVQ